MKRMILLFLASLLAAPVFAGNDPGRTPAAYSDVLTIYAGTLDVVALDSNGRPVTDLKRDDFRLFEDGEPLPVETFHYAGASPDGHRADALAEPLRVVFYFDDYDLRPENRGAAIAAVREFLASHPLPQAEYMLATYDRSLRVRQPFTRDPAEVSKALDEVAKLAGYRTVADRERLDFLERLAGRSPYLDCDESSVGELQMFAETLYNDTGRSLDALDDLVGSLSGMPGRKVIVHLSDGLEMRPAEDLFDILSERCLTPRWIFDAQSYDLTARYRDLVTHANAGEVTFYTLLAAGNRPLLDSGAATSQLLPPLADTRYEENVTGSLRYLATGTGGLATVNTNDLARGLETMATDLSHYYSLGYTPLHFADGRYHRVRAEVIRGGVRLRTPSLGYRALTVEQGLADATRAALDFRAINNRLAARVEEGQASRTRGDRYLVPVEIRVPVKNLELHTLADGSIEGGLRIYAVARDADGRTSPGRESLVPVHFPSRQAEAETNELTAVVSLLMRRGEQTLALGVQDEGSYATSLLTSRFVVGG